MIFHELKKDLTNSTAVEMGCYCLTLPQAPSFWLANATKKVGCYLISYYLRAAFLYSAQCAACSSWKHKTSSAPVWEKKACIIQPRVHWATDPLPSVSSPYLDTDVYDFLLNPWGEGEGQKTVICSRSQVVINWFCYLGDVWEEQK